MLTNAQYAQACSPSLAQEEEGEWVWVPKKTTATPGFPVSPHQSPMYRSLSADSPRINRPVMPCTPSSVSPAYSPVDSDIPSVSDGSPVEPFLDGLDMDMTLYLNAYLGDANPLWAFIPEPDNTTSMDLFTTSLDADLFSGLDLGLGPQGSYFTPCTPPTTVSPASSVYGTLGLPIATSPPLVPHTPASLPAASTSPESTFPITPAPTNLNQLLPCPEASCTKTFSNRTELRKHERKHRHPARCPLPHCGKGHLDNRAVARHLWAHHPDYAQQHNIRSERVKCPRCAYEGRRDNVARHMKRHSK